ncbi:MAG TPA: helix-hairpin-helix domain-containing protein [Candidatus Hydrogenedentes bacterium]|mgnify:CR=1 FL=1|nr:helix-hairpin-helix domain-containing protein [Candidatus Hydrogenedentota bacterium]
MASKHIDWRIIAFIAVLFVLAIAALGAIQLAKGDRNGQTELLALPASPLSSNQSPDEGETPSPPDVSQEARETTVPPSDSTITPSSITSESLQQSQTKEPEIAVAVAGEVNAPGFYRMPGDSRVQDLIKKAHGTTEFADLNDINIAAKLVDGTTLTIPGESKRESSGNALVLRKTLSAADLNPPIYTRSGWRETHTTRQTIVPSGPEEASSTEKPSDSASSSTGKGADGLIDLNTASETELDSLPGIGPKTAEKIIEYRQENPFTSVDDLTNIQGIGEKKLEAIRKYVTVR